MGSKLQERALDPAATAPEFYRVLFENDLVRVLQVNVPPGGKAAMHSHPDYVAYALSPSRTRLGSPNGGFPPRSTVGLDKAARPGNSGESDCVETLSMEPGEAVFRTAETHGHQNMGNEPARMLVFELKTQRRSGPALPLPEPDLLTVAPQFCRLLLDNGRCRLLDIRFSTGQSLGVHATLDQIVCPLIDGTVRVTYPDGIPQVMTLEQGKPFFVKATVVNVENIGRNDVHVLKLDLKP
jgi:quercetin dioxygenase-like cupin family protein